MSTHEQPPGHAQRWLTAIAFLAGAAGLLLAMGLDTLAVLGRLAGRPLLGSIELIQACVVVAASSSLVSATLSGSHASVHVLTERLAPRRRRALERISRLLCASFFVWLLWGSGWVAVELWGGQEATELLGLPIEPLRLFFCTSALIVVLLFLGVLSRPRAGGT
jgi:TRAP-type C4-dicarboxylate transport system permease small subunit